MEIGRWGSGISIPVPIAMLPSWSCCLNYAAKAENIVDSFLPYRIVDTLHLIGLRAASRGSGVWMFSIPGSGMQLFAVPLEIAACRPRIAGVGSVGNPTPEFENTGRFSGGYLHEGRTANAQYGDRFVS